MFNELKRMIIFHKYKSEYDEYFKALPLLTKIALTSIDEEERTELGIDRYYAKKYEEYVNRVVNFGNDREKTLKKINNL